MNISITPAYGRTIKTRADAIAQLRAGHDFEVQHPTLAGYACLTELRALGFTQAEVRQGLRLVAVIDISVMGGV